MDANQTALRLMRTIAIGGPGAAGAWQALPGDLDLDAVWEEGRPLYPAMGSRANELAPDHPRAAILAGVWRYTWTHNQIAIRTLLAELDGPEPLMQGRPATLVAYARTTGDMAFAPPPRPHHWAGPPEHTLDLVVQGTTLRVPAPAEHALERLWYGQPIDAAWAMQHESMDWDAFSGLARARGLSRRISPAVVSLADLGGPALVPPGVLDQLAEPPSSVTEFGRRAVRWCRVPTS